LWGATDAETVEETGERRVQRLGQRNALGRAEQIGAALGCLHRLDADAERRAQPGLGASGHLAPYSNAAVDTAVDPPAQIIVILAHTRLRLAAGVRRQAF
jgi:hypothetical protein